MAVAIAADPALTQCMSALEVANDVRIGRAAWKRELKTLDPAVGRAQVATRLLDRAPEIESMLVANLLRCAPGVGKKKVPRILFTAKIAAGWHVHQLTDRQRRMLAQTLCHPIGAIQGVR